MNNEEQSGFEELDPLPTPPRRKWRWEAGLAAALLLAVLGVGGWTWLNGALVSAAYRQAVGAEAAHHWADAQSGFAAAGGYQDATAREAAAAKQVQYLDQTYAQMQTAAQAGNWLSAWHLAQAVAAVQPDYRDIAQQTKDAYQALFAQDAAGLVYLQAQGAAPGLYVVGSDGAPNLLPDSTIDSRVLATSPDGRHFVYNGVVAPPGPDSGVCEPGAERLPAPEAAPRVMLAWLTTAVTPAVLPLPAAFDPQGTFWLTRQGLWGTLTDGHLAHYDLAIGQLQAGPALDSATRVVAAAADADALVLATALTQATASQVQIARLAPDGNRTVAGAVPGFLLTATASADGHYVAFETEDAQTGISRTLYLADFSAAPAAAPSVLDQISWRGVVLAAGLHASFVPGTPTTQLIVERQTDSGLAVSRYLLPDRTRTLLWTGADTIGRDDRSGLSPDGGGLAFRTQLSGQPYLAWVPVAGATPVVLPIHLLPSQLVDAWVAPQSAFLVYRVRNPDGLDKGSTEDVWSMNAPPAAGQAPQMIALVRRLSDATLPTLALPDAGSLLAYIAPDGSLRARTLDGTAQHTLAGNAEAVWAVTGGQ